jgi:hypothetical protein
MSLPFAMLVGQRAEQFGDAEISEKAFAVFNRWSLLSTDKLVSLDEVAWVGALMVRAFKASGVDINKNETRDANGARVVGVVASDGVLVQDGAA